MFEVHEVDCNQKQEQEGRHRFSKFQTKSPHKSNEFFRFTGNDTGERCASEVVIKGLNVGLTT